jgi:hypothetical protein
VCPFDVNTALAGYEVRDELLNTIMRSDVEFYLRAQAFQQVSGRRAETASDLDYLYFKISIFGRPAEALVHGGRGHVGPPVRIQNPVPCT